MSRGQSSSSLGVASSVRASQPGLQHQSSPLSVQTSDNEHYTRQVVPRDHSSHTDELTAAIITRIEDVVEDIVDALAESRPLSIPLRSRRSGNQVAVLFPTSSSSGARRFTALLQLLYYCHEALVTGTVLTKRYIFYQNPELFITQRYVDGLVDDIAHTFGVSRDSLNIVAASKGLVAGGHFGGGIGNNGVTVPLVRYLDDIDTRLINWILIVEKEATFRGLCAARYFETSAAKPGILVTAKGYPDLATRQFLFFICTHCPHIPAYALVDFDPDGIGIMRTYKHGSRSLLHEKNATLPGLIWLGVKSDDITNVRSLPMSRALSQSQQNPGDVGHILEETSGSGPLSRRLSAMPLRSRLVGMDCYKTSALSPSDRRKAVNLLLLLDNQDQLQAEDAELLREMQFMLMLNLKFEIQAVEEGGSMTDWLDRRLTLNMD